MVYAILTCSDEACGASYEGWGALHELERVACELCGCMLEAVAFSDASHNDAAPRSVEVHLRDAA